MKPDPFIKLFPKYFYHIYNRGNNSKKIFFNKGNYYYFLSKFDFYLSGYLTVLAYSLLPNHFHMLIRVSSDTNHEEISFQFRRFFICYSKSINKQMNRTGSLFQKNFKRRLINDENYLRTIIQYIHFNPERHKIIDDYRDYEFSSFKRYKSDYKDGVLSLSETSIWN